MNHKLTLLRIFFFVAFFIAANAKAQQPVFKWPILNIDFGNADKTAAPNVGNLSHYEEARGYCPEDGYYSFETKTNNCFGGNWITMYEDHTPGDRNGRMMIVNASNEPGIFFMYALNNLTPNANYEISLWLVNICSGSNGCSPTPPVISFSVLTSAGKQLARFRTGNIMPTGRASWLRYYGEFMTPPGVTDIILKFEDETNGGCGNDFAMDDIVLREFTIQQPPPVRKEQPKQAVANPGKANTITKKPLEKTTIIKAVPAPTVAKPIKKNNAIITKTEVKTDVTPVKTLIKEQSKFISIPSVLLTRINPVIKNIELPTGDILIELYDNGEIDGDTVSIYHNNELLVANAGLSLKPVSLKLRIDKHSPHHELVMVANNLGSIPPNTSLMVITANGQRYEVFISSSEQKNAKIIFDLRE